ncbi:MAG: two-component system response regulator [Microbacterium sp.]|uniref:Transcriptional regulatory protein n=2 Tax=Microbacterium TaxID=33882 RepID=A0A0F0LVI9_9MICO|nr:MULTISPECIES: response regulator [Microbacterium]KJL36315.1 Transcriptional regulatory protein DcuR [Microbacterium ginsengisoli]MAL05923.1 two-component system response regulator [Microbacterium sp.]MCK9917539.1 response regulator [Microbacteriaceae bacterium K1510]HAN25296.1 two-component system response regulator [Microbacterium ginsengisoli]
MIRVMIVDDEALTLELHRSYVERLPGFEVVAECTSARAAHRALVEQPPPGGIDLVLLDVTMPDGTGVDVLRQARAAGVDVDVVAVTSVRDAEVVRQMVALGAVQYLVKPFTFAAFRERVEPFRDYRERVASATGAATQSEIDGVLGASRPRVAASLPKGLAETSLRRVIDAVREHGPLSAAEAGELLGMSRVSARRYLEHLAGEGRIERAARYGSPGRPESEYRWVR